MIIAERTLRFMPHGKRGARKVVVRIHAPKQGKNENWSVLVEIRGPGQHARKRSIWGVDAVQALVYAMAMVPLDLRAVAGELGGQIKFLGREDLGFTVKTTE